MKIFSIFSLFFLFEAIITPKKVFLERVSLGQFSYNIYKEDKYLHDDNFNATFYTVYKVKSNIIQCSGFKQAGRNDSIFINGTYKVDGKKLIFTEYHYFKKHDNFSDTLIKVFYSDKRSGKLLLTESIIYKNGKSTKIKW